MNIKKILQPGQPQYKILIICLGLIIATLAVYWQVTSYDFVNYDDPQYITKNYHVKKGFSLKTIRWALTAEVAGNWHPLTVLSHIADCHFFGVNSGMHHLINILLHTINTLLLFFVFLRMTGSIWRCAFLAAFFALHPLHVESVAWISERKDVLSAFFCLITIWCYLRYSERPGKTRYFIVFLFFAMGLMSKPMLVTLPFVLLILDVWPLGRIKSNIKENIHLIIEKIPLFILTAFFCIITLVYQKSGKGFVSVELIPFQMRLLNTPISYKLHNQVDLAV